MQEAIYMPAPGSFHVHAPDRAEQEHLDAAIMEKLSSPEKLSEAASKKRLELNAFPPNISVHTFEVQGG